MISHNNKCIFVEVPKTGSTSIRSLLLGNSSKPHLDICQIKHEMEFYEFDKSVSSSLKATIYLLLPAKKRKKIIQQRKKIAQKQFEEYFKFGFVRNPWDRVVSLYNRKEGLQMKDKMTFEEFVDWIKYSSSTCLHPSPHVNQLDWFCDGSGNILVDFIGKFERIQDDWAFVAETLNLPRQLPHKNANKVPRKHYTEYYSQKTKEIIQNKFRTDIEYFSYTFAG